MGLFLGWPVRRREPLPSDDLAAIAENECEPGSTE